MTPERTEIRELLNEASMLLQRNRHISHVKITRGELSVEVDRREVPGGKGYCRMGFSDTAPEGDDVLKATYEEE